MKKTMFALACAAVCVAGAETINSVDFESAVVGPLKIAPADDTGVESGTPYFVYTASSGSTDGSTVAEHEEGALTGWDDKSFEKQYLSLSTEGGTLWRSILAAKKTAEEKDSEGNVTKPAEWTTGDPQTVPDTGLYIDTMVQFTPTEDGSEPELGEDAKLAIWLNVAQAEDGTATTNLCVRGAAFTGVPSDLTWPVTNFVLQCKDDSSQVVVAPGEWHRLTVKALKICYAGEGFGWIYGFQIFIDGKALKASEAPFSEDWLTSLASGDIGDGLEEGVTEGDLLTVIPSLTGVLGEVPSLSAVGFKGSGAIDDFCVTDEPPSFTATEVTTVDFTLQWDQFVSSVTYTIGGDKKELTKEEVAAKKKVLKVDEGAKVTVNATAADWYKVWAGTGEFTVETNMVNQIKTREANMSELDIESFPTNTTASASEVKTWADGKTISLDALKNNEYAYDSFLLGTDLLTADPVLTIDDVTVADGMMTITVAAKKGATDGGASIDLDSFNGALYVNTGDTLGSMKEVVVILSDDTFDGKLTVTLKSGKFAQVKIGAKPDETQPPAE